MAAILDWSNILAGTGLVATFADEASLEIGLNELVLPPLFSIAAKGQKFVMVGIDGSIRSAEAQDAIDRYTGLTADEENAIAIFVDAEVANSNWGTNAANYSDALYDAFWCFALVTEANALIDMHQVLKLTAVNNGAIKVADGFDFSLSANSLDTVFVPSTQGVNYQLDDAMHGVFLKDADAVGANTVLYQNGDTSVFGQMRTGGTYRGRINSPTGDVSTGGGVVAADSLLIVLRTESTIGQIFKNGVIAASTAHSSSALPPTSTVIGLSADNPNTIVSTFICAGAVGFDQVGHNTNLRQLLTNLGVLP